MKLPKELKKGNKVIYLYINDLSVIQHLNYIKGDSYHSVQMYSGVFDDDDLDFKDFEEASQSAMGFWDNLIDDEVWNGV